MKLLIPVDGSPFSEEALPMALPIARACQAEVHLLRVSPESSEAAEWAYGGMPPSLHEAAMAKAESELSSHLHTLAERLEGLPVTTSVIFHDSAAEEIIAYAARESVDLIVMTTHGRTGPREKIMGGVSRAVLASGVAPVLFVRPGGLPKRQAALEAAIQLPG
jgi:nucleotide-binding universal stress UspA family protein